MTHQTCTHTPHSYHTHTHTQTHSHAHTHTRTHVHAQDIKYLSMNAEPGFSHLSRNLLILGEVKNNSELHKQTHIRILNRACILHRLEMLYDFEAQDIAELSVGAG